MKGQVPEDDPAANLMHPSATDGSNFSLNAKVHNLPAGKNPSGCTWDSGSGTDWSAYIGPWFLRRLIRGLIPPGR